jgi:hypothetical protein
LQHEGEEVSAAEELLVEDRVAEDPPEQRQRRDDKNGRAASYETTGQWQEPK